MKNKLFVLLLAISVTILAFTSCDLFVGECEHTFSEEWTSDEKSHWHAATCEHGEIQDSLADHTDMDEDGFCDVCEREIGHDHTFVSEWSYDDTKHWKAPTCTHTDVKGEEALHTDDNTDGVCDVCSGHVHILDGAGFCEGCDKEIKPVVETDLGSVVSATTARGDKINGGTVEYDIISRNVTESVEVTDWHKVIYALGTNGTYSQRFEYDNDGVLTLLEKWIPMTNEDSVTGVSAMSIDGVYIDAMPSSFGREELLGGYYYAVSTLADGYTPDAVLMVIYTASQAETASDLVIDHDIDANKYVFSFNYYAVNATKMDDGSTVYNVSYFETKVEFTYRDDYTITSLNIECDAYTNDPGTGNGGKSYEADVDLDYDPDTKTMTLREGAKADSYKFVITTTVGERGEVEMNDGSEFAPTDFNLYESLGAATPVTDVTFSLTDNDTEIFLVATPEGCFMSFIRNSINVTVTDKLGNTATGLGAFVVGDVIQLLPNVAGEYVVTVEAIGVTRSFNVTVEGVDLAGANFITVTATDTYSWVDLVEFTADKAGTYTFHLPPYVGAWDKDAYDVITSGVGPYVDPGDPHGYVDDADHYFSVDLRKNQTYRFYIKVNVTGEYTIGYDYDAPVKTLSLGDNTVSVTDAERGRRVSFTVTATADYVITVGENTKIIYNKKTYSAGETLEVTVYAGYPLEFVAYTLDGTASDAKLTVAPKEAE
ncbi:MAG: hypothetical protein IKC87_01705 [Clostridia bacterium]|nr:hypothetical protein [Clostridia bacterium]